ATAQAVTLSALNYNNVMAAVVNQASISAVNEVDAYRFTFKPNDLISLAVINENPVPNPRVNPFLRLFDTDGTTVLLSNSDTRFSGNSFGQPGDPVYVNGSILLNFFTASGGDYFVQVLGEGAANTGNYELFVMAQSVPEPATLALLGVSLSATGYIWYRRRRHHRKALEATIRV
ncbi:MAG TPA: PEP-CTERM sorting domain-containing protein, partial [Gemmatales bacterium]|nr:PEP-CTERM sorting domain-containing protein [Gemmatales bacterium]